MIGTIACGILLIAGIIALVFINHEPKGPRPA